MTLQTVRRTTNYLIILSSLLFSYNNCSPNTSFKGTKSFSSSSNLAASISTGACVDSTPCEDQLMRFYGGGYQQFLTQNCATCHSAGPGKGQFANNNLCSSYKDFMQVGYSKVSNNALSDAHNPPFSGPQHLQTINELRLSWVKALAEYDICLGNDGNSTNTLSLDERAQFSFGNKVIPAMNDNEEKRVEFDLTQIVALKSLPVPTLPGAKFSVMIKKEVKGENKTYVIHSPKIFNSTQDIHLKGLFTKINGRYIQYSTNFRFAEAKIRKGTLENTPDAIISTGALVIAGAMSPSDQVGFDVELIEATVIPPPPPPVQLAINAPNAITVDSSGFIDLEVKLSQASTETVSFVISADDSRICGVNSDIVSVNNSTCLPDVYNLICPSGTCSPEAQKFSRARSIAGTPFNRFDWDYKFTSTSMVFAVGETSKTIRLNLSKDVRYETNRLLSLKVETGIGNAVLGKSVVHLVFNKRKNPVPPSNEVTYSMLMSANTGILKLHCNNCHNSDEAQQQGGYDIADWDLMVNRGVLKPGQDFRRIDPTTGNVIKTYASKMFKRMNTQDPDIGTFLGPMPKDGYLDYDTEISPVENWILNGAKNN